mgnify:CR=1 FL=1
MGATTAKRMAWVLLVIGFIVSPGVAGAHRVFEGSDYADDNKTTYTQRLDACDRESDGHSVHADDTAGNSGWIHRAR